MSDFIQILKTSATFYVNTQKRHSAVGAGRQTPDAEASEVRIACGTCAGTNLTNCCVVNWQWKSR